MEDYPRSIYFSASWRGASQALELLLTRELAERGFTLIGDHKIHKTQDTGLKLHWQQRIDVVVAGCHGIVAILQKTEESQTTSPYQFPELLMASRHGLPLLIIHPPGVQVRKQSKLDGKCCVLEFGDANTPAIVSLPTKEGGSRELLSLECCLSDETLNSVNKLDFPNAPFMPDPLEHTEFVVTEKLTRHLDRFVSELVEVLPSYVFNVIPFRRKREHEVIARTVFRETGMPCYTALDRASRGGSSREHWQRLLSEASFVITDLDLGNRNCVFEAGVAFAMADTMQIVHRGPLRGAPFGLDDITPYLFENEAQLSEQVSQICLPFKRTVFNLEKLVASEDQPIPGVPGWFTEGGAEDDAGVRLQAVVFLVLAAGLFAVAGYLQNWLPLTIGGVAVAGAAALVKVVSGAVPQFRKDMDTYFIRCANRLWWICLGLLVLAVVACIAAAWIRFTVS